MQVQVMAAESLENKNEVYFPEYDKDNRLSSWNCAVEKVSLPSSLIKEKFG